VRLNAYMLPSSSANLPQQQVLPILGNPYIHTY